MRILYFAWLRERLSRSGEDVSVPESVVTAGDLLAWLGTRDAVFAALLEEKRVLRVAVDEVLVTPDAAIAGARTIAIFPPMTGG